MSRTKETAQPALTWREYCEAVPRLAARIQSAEAEYLGVCIVQTSAAWTRTGPTWHVPRLGYVVVGPGVAQWKTTHGLAQLAVDPAVAPQWHATAVVVVPDPQLVIAVADAVVRVGPAWAAVRALGEPS